MAAVPAARPEEQRTDRGERGTHRSLVSDARRLDVAPPRTAVSAVLIALASPPSHLTSPSAGHLVLPGRASFETPR
ncbi:hypothetical protein PV379_09915 [Streptomyces caniscabiei]|uniref:hypothetical protein n=1 Tax=Streptomyces caniscabiei TaxID=2746961 RepID=UPI0029BD684F|nr:hypothetical protein [Streptomyces caniscabiei]MDX2600052.1 hypothetical protein [Streptomyces caniscabiei]MDX2734655.1 hypothetical protein [Streptomyces caniscabiei]MDX2777626.1 hypothetical protein [Streptomyces caniscabiei]